MEQMPDLDDLALFVQVARGGGLAAAARESGVSVPTLSRKMQQLEQRLGRSLFVRGARGYTLTGEGRELQERLAILDGLKERLMRDVARDRPVKVRITAGTWMSMYLARRLRPETTGQGLWQPEFLEATARLDIARREADIGLRNQRPDQSWLAGRQVGRVECAPFARDPEVAGYVALRETVLQPPSGRWLLEHYPDRIVATAGSVRMLADMALAGIGRVILPRFAAADFPELVQVGPSIEALGHTAWLVCHHEARHDPPVRAALDCVTKVLTQTDPIRDYAG